MVRSDWLKVLILPVRLILHYGIVQGTSMNKTALWSIKGVDFDAREAAKQAAHRQGMSLGEWLNSIIVDKAEELGLEADEVDGIDRLEAITARLARMSNSPAAHSGQRKTGRARQMSVRARRSAKYERDNEDEAEIDREIEEELDDLTLRRRKHQRNSYAAAIMRQRSRLGRESLAAHREPDYFDPELLLEEAVMAFEQGARDNQAETNAALAKVSRRLANIEAAMDERAGKPAVQIKAVETKVIDSQSAQQPETMSVHEAISRLESRLEQLTKNAQAKPTQTPMPQALTEASAPAPETQSSPFLRPANTTLAPSAGFPPHLAQAILQIAERQKALEETLSQREAPVPSQLDSEIKAELGRLLKRLEDMRQESHQREELFRQESTQRDLWLEKETQRLEQTRYAIEKNRASPEFDHIRQQLADMGMAIANLAPRDLIQSLEASLYDLTSRVEAWRSHLPQQDALLPVDQLLAEVRGLLSDFAPRSTLDAVGSELRQLTKRIDDVAVTQIDISAVQILQGQMDDIKQILLRTMDYRLPFEAMQNDLSLLAERMDQLLIAGSGQSAEDLKQIVESIRNRLGPSIPSKHLHSLEERLDSLSKKMDQILDLGDGAQQIDDLTRQITQFQNLLFDRLDRSAPSLTDLSALETQLNRLVEKIDHVAHSSQPSMVPDLHRETLIEAAQMAAQQVLHQIQSQSIMHIASPLPQSLDELRQQQILDNQLTHETLTAVHETLEKVVDRITHLEQEMGEAHPISNKSALERQSIKGREFGSRDTRPGTDSHDLTAHNQSPVRSTSFERANRARLSDNDLPSLTSGLPDLEIIPGSRLDFTEDRQSLLMRQTSTISVDPGANQDMLRPDHADDQSSQASFISAARRAAQKNGQALDADKTEEKSSGLQIDTAMPAARARARAAAAALSGDDEMESQQSGAARPAILSKPVIRKAMIGVMCLVIALGSLQFVKSSQSGNSAQGNYQPLAPKAPPPASKSTEDDSSKAIQSQENVGGNVLIFAPDMKEPTSAPNRQSSLGKQTGDPFPVSAINPLADNTIKSMPPDETSRLAQIRDAAQHNQVNAQFELADRFAEGMGVPRDAKQAAQWFERAALQDLPVAQYRLGSIYEKGLGVDRDLNKAKFWYAKAAERGNIKAMHNLAVLLADGGSNNPDYVGAKKWFLKAAENGVRDSQFNLAVLNARGLGTPQDVQSAYVWFAIAAQQGDSEAAKKRDELNARLSGEQMKAAKSTIAAFAPRNPIVSANDVEPFQVQVNKNAQPQATKNAPSNDKQTSVQPFSDAKQKITLKAKL